MSARAPHHLAASTNLRRFGLTARTGMASNRQVVMPKAGEHPPSAKPVRLTLPVNARGDETAVIDAVFAPDDSGSMYGSWGDPRGVRYAAALSVIDLMRRLGGGRAGVVHWGTEAPAELALSLTDVRQGRRALRKSLRIPATLCGNDFPAALRRCAEVLGERHFGRVPLVFALTDGIEWLGSDIHPALAALPPRSVHVLLIDHSHGCGEELEAQWHALPLGSFTRLDVLDTRHMAWQIAEIVVGAVGLVLPSPDPVPAITKE